MMDSQDTNLPLKQDGLEEEKKNVEISDTTETNAPIEEGKETQDEGETTEETTENTTLATQEIENPAVEAEEPVTEEIPEQTTSQEVVLTEEDITPEEVAPAEVAEENVPAQESIVIEAQPATEEESPETEQEATVLQPEVPAVEEIAVPEETPAAKEALATEAEDEKAVALPADKEGVISRLKELAALAEESSRQEVELLKQTFYKYHNAELESARQAFLDNGGTEEEYVPATDELEATFKALMATIREKRSARSAQLEKTKEDNLQIKLSIIEELKELVESGEDTNKNFNEFKKLQQQWNEIKLVPQGKVNELWKNYHLYVEKFYDLLKLNNEFREYDFKKNLELKNRLCEAAEKLAEEPDVVSAFHQLQKLHQEFRDTGPVGKELREEIWTRFKTASTQVNRRHQQHFEALKENEQLNLDQKTVICEIVEAIDYKELNSFSTWDAKTQEVIALQNKWKTIGFAPQKMNVKIFERFRKACDEFFRNKAAFFKEVKEKMNQNLEKKRALCEQAEALRESTDWKETAEVLSRLQKEWKTIGPVPKKHSDAIWKRFIGSCDYFFEKKGKANSSQRSVEHENLDKKKAIISKLAAIESDMNAEEAETLVKELMKEWNTIGHVPFKEKDKIYKQYHQWIDTHFDQFNLQASNKRLNTFRSNISNIQEEGSGSQTIYREREKLVRTYENMKNELKTYENNLGFLTASSKKGSSLLTEMNRKAEKLKGELELIQEKIRIIDQSLKKEE